MSGDDFLCHLRHGCHIYSADVVERKLLTGLSSALLEQLVATYCHSFFSNDLSDLIFLCFNFFFIFPRMNERIIWFSLLDDLLKIELGNRHVTTCKCVKIYNHNWL